MNIDEAIDRIQDHMVVHKIGTYPHIKIGEALKIAIFALKDLKRRSNGCPYCRSSQALLNTTKEYSGLEFTMLSNLLRVRYISSDKKDSFETQDVITLNYCPKCGRKLEEKWKTLTS